MTALLGGISVLTGVRRAASVFYALGEKKIFILSASNSRLYVIVNCSCVQNFTSGAVTVLQNNQPA